MEGFPNEHKTSTRINDCHTDFGVCTPSQGGSPASCPQNMTDFESCAVPNANEFVKFYATLDVDGNDFLTLAELQQGMHKLDITDSNPISATTIADSYSLILDIFGMHRIIHKDTLAKIVLERRFPSGYRFGIPSGKCDLQEVCQSAEGKERGSVVIPSLLPGTEVMYNFVTFKSDGSRGYQNTGIWIKDVPGKYGADPRLYYSRGSRSGTVTISDEGNGAFAYVLPYGPYWEGSAYGGTWSLELCAEIMVCT